MGKFTLVAHARSGAVRRNLCEAAGVSHAARPAIAGGVALQHPGCYCAGCFSWCSGAQSNILIRKPSQVVRLPRTLLGAGLR